MTKLDEALEAPNLPDEDEWIEEDYVTEWMYAVTDSLNDIDDDIAQMEENPGINLKEIAKRNLGVLQGEFKHFPNWQDMSYHLFGNVDVLQQHQADYINATHKRYEILADKFNEALNQINFGREFVFTKEPTGRGLLPTA